MSETNSITYEKVESIHSRLSKFRGSGREDILFDTRDKGNYSEYEWENTLAMFKRTDPTALASALLVGEMIEATIVGSNVRLSDVLRQPDFLSKINVVSSLQDEMEGLVSAPRERLLKNISAGLERVSSDFGRLSNRELAVCMRDALFCMDSGLSLNWLSRTERDFPEHLPLCPEIRWFPSLADFALSIRGDMPFGAHLARIGLRHTVVGMKTQAGIAYFSSMSIDPSTGKMVENRPSGSHMTEKVDLNTPLQRYPDWTPISEYYNGGTGVKQSGIDEHKLDDISKLPRDVLVWTALVVDLGLRRMAMSPVAKDSLSELATPAATPERHFPVVYSPNWECSPLSLQEAFDSLNFSSWERGFLSPALEKLSVEACLPLGVGKVGINLDTMQNVPCPSERDSFYERERFHETSLEIISMSPNLVGTKTEVEAARKAILGNNLMNILLVWGNREFEKKWREWEPEYLNMAKANARNIIGLSCSKDVGPDFSLQQTAKLFSQSSKHKTFKAKCVFNEKSEVSNVAFVHPMNAADLVSVLGLSSEDDLPDFIKGWDRNLGWATSTRHLSKKGEEEPPFYTNLRWCFTDGEQFCGFGHRPFDILVNYNAANLILQETPVKKGRKP